MNNNLDSFFFLAVKKTDGSTMSYRFTQEATLGTDPRNDIILNGPTISPKYLHFKNHINGLTLTFLGPNDSARLNHVTLLKNKMYMLEKKDIIQIGLNEITIL